MSRRERDVLLGHAEDNDGIEEYDNPLPDWWLGMFYFSILFAIGYTLEYHFISDRSHVAEYKAEMAAAAEKWPEPEGGVAIVMTDEALSAGETTYVTNCVGCHGATLTGGIGPDLTDTEWIHGGSPEEVRHTITEGVPEKGMLAWGPMLGPQKIAEVTAYVLSKNTGKAPAAPADGAAEADATGDAGTVAAPSEGAEDAMAEMDPLAQGEAIFAANCVACHSADLTGGVGPNLVDDEWIHGGTPEDVRRVITEGVPAKGMVTWGPILGEEKVALVADYILAKGQSASGEPSDGQSE